MTRPKLSGFPWDSAPHPHTPFCRDFWNPGHIHHPHRLVEPLLPAAEAQPCEASPTTLGKDSVVTTDTRSWVGSPGPLGVRFLSVSQQDSRVMVSGLWEHRSLEGSGEAFKKRMGLGGREIWTAFQTGEGKEAKQQSTNPPECRVSPVTPENLQERKFQGYPQV